MFQSVINQPGLSAGRFGTGMWVSLMVHAGVFAGALGLSGRAVEQIQKEPTEITMIRGIPQPPKGNPIPPKVTPATPAKPRKPKTELVQPRNIPPPPPETQPAVETPPPEDTEPETNDLPYVPGSHPDGVETGGVAGATYIANAMLGNGNVQGTGEEVLPFGAGMTPPQIVSTGVPLQYTLEAARARVSGVVIAKCTITREGNVEKCRIIKGLPYMDEAVLESLTSRHYRPVTYQGRAVSVTYNFQVSLKMP
ncbi:energy transducer TonB [Archangium lansingense]|uniref:TonB family protein n=1 Tax=Archangium lansingense TaxID=2995310 RepID=A0ABT4A8I0_9BACT|nr:energy transducer TonB [Archangium lansinium]MCY1077242.1 TonB family protein [Archangium lansinium]